MLFALMPGARNSPCFLAERLVALTLRSVRSRIDVGIAGAYVPMYENVAVTIIRSNSEIFAWAPGHDNRQSWVVALHLVARLVPSEIKPTTRSITEQACHTNTLSATTCLAVFALSR